MGGCVRDIKKVATKSKTMQGLARPGRLSWCRPRDTSWKRTRQVMGHVAEAQDVEGLILRSNFKRGINVLLPHALVSCRPQGSRPAADAWASLSLVEEVCEP